MYACLVYATGDDVAFASSPDVHLAAHEAAHVVQQRAGVQLKSGVGQSGDQYEVHADQVADAVVRGESAERLLGNSPSSESASSRANASRNVQKFSSSEHRALGNEASGDEQLGGLSIDGKPLSYGDMVALGGDYFANIDEITDLMKTKEGQEEVRWALNDSRGTPQNNVSPEAAARARERYEKLAGNNINHFSHGGTAIHDYESGHVRALYKAVYAGAQGNSCLFSEAVVDEAFSNHFLSDMFSAGHVRTPRAALKTDNEGIVPGSIDKIIGGLATLMASHVDWPRSWDALALAQLADPAEGLQARITSMAGKAAEAFSLGDIMSLAQHDADNQGLDVVSQAAPWGATDGGGDYQWHAVGDGKLKSEASGVTANMAKAAMRDSRGELDMAYMLGAGIKSGPSFPADVMGVVESFRPFAALKYIPRVDPEGQNEEMNGTWGEISEPMREALNRAIREEIVPELRKKADLIEPAVVRLTFLGEDAPADDPDPYFEFDARAAFLAAIDDVEQLGFAFIQDGVGGLGMPIPLVAGVPSGGEAQDAGVD